MRSPLILGLAAALVCLAIVPARGQPRTAAFDELRSELESRRDHDFAGPLDGAGRRQRAAVLRSLARIDRESDSLRDDLGTAVGVAASLERAYRPEFLPGGGDSALGTLVDSCLDMLESRAMEELSTAQVRIYGLSPEGYERLYLYLEKTMARNNERRQRVLRLPEDAPGRRTLRARALVELGRIIERANGIADRDPGLPYAVSTLEMTVDDGLATARFDADLPRVVVDASEDGFLLTASWDREDGSWRLHLFVPGVIRIGSQDLAVDGFEGYVERTPPGAHLFRPPLPSVRYAFEPGGNFVLNIYDRKHLMYGGFEFRALGDDGTPLSRVHGFFRIYDVEEVP